MKARKNKMMSLYQNEYEVYRAVESNFDEKFKHALAASLTRNHTHRLLRDQLGNALKFESVRFVKFISPIFQGGLIVKK